MEKDGLKTRYHLLDELRGLAVLCMVVYHGFFSVSMVLNIPLSDRLIAFFMPAEPFFAALFIFISGICSTLSRSNLKNGLRLAVIALGITAVTVVGDRLLDINMSIFFGVIHLLACCLLLAALTDKLKVKYRFPKISLAVLALLFLITYDLVFGSPFLPCLGLSELGVKMPYGFTGHPWLLLFGFPEPGIGAMADYFPLTPWVFMFFMGACFANIRGRGVLPAFFAKKRVGFLGAVGRHSLIIYVVHQPVIFGLCYLTLFLTGGNI